MYEKSLRSNSPVDLSIYKAYKSTLQKIKRRSKRDYFINKCIKFKNDTCKLWKVINNVSSYCNDKSCIIDSIKINNIEITESKLIANEMGKFFATIGYNTAMKGGNSKVPISKYLEKIPNETSSVFLAPCTVIEIKKLIENLPNKMSSGYDNISNILLKKIQRAIAPPLNIVFNKSLSEGIFPDCMKLADVTPLFKGGNRLSLNNYRPISLLPTLSKLLEKIMYSRTYSFLTKYDLLYKSQYGFRKKHSCEHAVTELIGEICKGLETKKHTMAVFIDLSKAFDTISHDLLLKKMSLYGIRGKALDWYTSYLENRVMRAKCSISTNSQTVFSERHHLNIGTPQGSCLGPLLFLIFCNDLYLNLDLCGGILFADDTTIYKTHEHKEYLKWCIIHDLTILIDWFKANHLSMNANKTVGMHFSADKKSTIDALQIDDIKINFVESTKFLGVWLDNKLTWKEHATRVGQKIYKNLNLLKISKKFLDLHSKRLLYFAQIQSHLTYGLSIWGNMLSTTALSRLQRLQNKSIALINSKKADKVEYQNLKILTLQQLLELENRKFGFKLLHNDLPDRIIELSCSDQKGKCLKKNHKYNTRHKGLLNKPLAKNKLYKNCIIYKGTSPLEPLEAETKLKPSLISFVSACKKELLRC